jgi:acyl carrier protein
MTQIPADAPLAGVIHAAGTLEDKALLQQDWAAFAKVFAPKVWGAWHLHQLTAAQALDFFVVFSSITGLLGHAGQANHAAANVFLDGLMHYRRARQLPGLSIAWGAWSEVGVAAQLAHQHQSSMQARGEGVIDPQQGIQSFAYLLQQHSTHVGVMPTDWNRFLLTPPAQTAFFADFARQFASSEPAAAITIQASLRQQLIQATEPEQRRRILMDYLQETVGRVLAWNKPGLLDEQAGLMDVGMDSLMAVELRNILGRAIEQQLPATLLFTYPTLAALADYLLQQVIASGGDQVAAADSLDELSPDALADILATELR